MASKPTVSHTTAGSSAAPSLVAGAGSSSSASAVLPAYLTMILPLAGKALPVSGATAYSTVHCQREKEEGRGNGGHKKKRTSRRGRKASRNAEVQKKRSVQEKAEVEAEHQQTAQPIQTRQYGFVKIQHKQLNSSSSPNNQELNDCT